MAKRIHYPGQKIAVGCTATAAGRIFHDAIETVQAQVKDTNSLHGGAPVLLETLFPEAPTFSHPALPVFAFTQEFSAWLTMVQINRTASMLKDRLAVPDGLADPGVVIFGVFPGDGPYMRGLLERIASDIAGRFKNDGLDAFIDLVMNRFCVITRDGLTMTGVSEAELGEIYARQVDWHQDQQRRIPLSRPTDPLQPRRNGNSRTKRTAVVLGCPPLVDEYDVAIAACGQPILQGPAQPIPHNHDGNNDGILDATSQAVLNALSRNKYLLSPEEYWRHYKDFLAIRQTLPSKNGVEPLSPGRYRELLTARQALRDARLRLLASYTGLHRRNATEQDVLAEPYPLFFRLTEELVRQTGSGVASLVSPTGFLSGQPTERMRKQLHSHFNFIEIVEMHGVTQEKATFNGLPPGGTTDLAINIMGKTGDRNRIGIGKSSAEVLYLNVPKGDEPNLSPLLPFPSASDSHAAFKSALPSTKNGYSFRPPAMSEEYLSWPSTAGIYSVSINGAMGKRGGLLFDAYRECLAKRMRAYFDANLSWEGYAKLGFGDEKEQKRFNPRKIWEEARRKEGYSEERIKPYLLKPFDARWCYYTPTRPLWDEPRPELAALQDSGNHFLVVRSNQAVDGEGIPFFFTNLLGDSDLLRGHAYYIPTWHKGWNGKRSANLSKAIQKYVDALGMLRNSTLEDAALLVHYHVLAVGFAPAYLHENRVELGQGWPRIPFPGFDPVDPRIISDARETFQNSAKLGRLVAQLLAGDSSKRGSDMRTTADGLYRFAVLTEEPAAHQEEKDRLFVVDRGWGKVFRDGAVLPSHGKLSVRDYSQDERQAVETVARSMRVHAGAAYSLLGDSTRDIYLNDRVCLRNVPAKVWDFTVGGYQVLKKWLSYRETAIMGRPLTFEEVEDFCTVIRRIVGLKLMGFHLNKSYSIIRDSHREECIPSQKY